MALALALILPLLMLVLASYVGLPGLGARRIASLPERPGADGIRAVGQGHVSPLTSAYVNRVIGGTGRISSSGTTDAAAGVGATEVSAAPGERPVTVDIPPQSNDEFDQAFGIGTLPFTGTTDTRGATRQKDEPGNCSAVLGTVWFKYTPVSSGALTVSTFGSSYDTITGIFTGAWGNLHTVSCAAATVADFDATAGTTYYFQVAGNGGDLVFHLVTAAGVPSVDRVSVADDGHQEIFGGNVGSISADGRFVAFNTGDETMTGKSELLNVLADIGYVRGHNCTSPGDIKPDLNPAEPTHVGIRPDCNVVYVNDRLTRRNTWIDFGYQEVLSDDGRYVAYTGSGARQSDPQVFLVDRLTGHRWLVNHALGSRTREANGWSIHPVISGDGRYVAFTSIATDSVVDDANGTAPDAFLWDRVTGRIRLITTDSRGVQQDGTFPGVDWEDGFMDCLSRDGRWAVFATQATNFDVFNARGIWELYRKDLRSGRLERVSVPLGGGLPTGDSRPPGVHGGHCISSNGRFVAFPSFASNLVPRDTNGTVDFFVRDMRRHVTQRVDVSSTGSQAIGDSHGCPTSGIDTPFGRGACSGTSTNYECSITPDGRYIGFNSGATNLVANDTNNTWDVFRHDLLTGETIRLSVPDAQALSSKAGPAGGQGFGGDSVGGDMSADGRVLLFVSTASNFVAADTNNVGDVFVAVLPRRPS